MTSYLIVRNKKKDQLFNFQSAIIITNELLIVHNNNNIIMKTANKSNQEQRRVHIFMHHQPECSSVSYLNNSVTMQLVDSSAKKLQIHGKVSVGLTIFILLCIYFFIYWYLHRVQLTISVIWYCNITLYRCFMTKLQIEYECSLL